MQEGAAKPGIALVARPVARIALLGEDAAGRRARPLTEFGGEPVVPIQPVGRRTARMGPSTEASPWSMVRTSTGRRAPFAGSVDERASVSRRLHIREPSARLVIDWADVVQFDVVHPHVHDG